MSANENMRSAFEAWAIKDGFVIAEFNAGRYAYGATQIAWEAWRASYKAAVADAANAVPTTRKQCSLLAGEMSAQEWRTACALLTYAQGTIRQLGGE